MIYATRQELNSIPVPEETSWYKPVSTKLIFDTIDDLSREQGFTLQKELLDTKAKGQLQRMRFNFYTGNPRFSFEVAVLNSYNKQLSLRCGSGASAVICWNLMVMAPSKIHERHQGDVREDLYDFLKESFGEKSKQVTNANTIYNAFDMVPLSRREIAELAGRLIFEEKLLLPMQAKTLREELDEPSFRYDCNLESLNGLYQHVTHAIKTEAPTTYLQTQQAVQEFFVETYEEVTQNKLILV